MNSFFLVPASLLVCLTSSLHAQTFSSGEAKVPLIELYTSEGCSSCPPAEAWLSSLRTNKDLWKKFVPVAFHVTYWDYLGWKDGLAEDAFTKRQRAYAASWNSGTVYTPGFVRDGAEWRSPRGELEFQSSGKVGNLTVAVSGDTAEVSFQPTERSSSPYEVHLATIGGKIESRVRAGENSGRTLRHDFVAMSLQSSPLKSSPEGKLSSTFSFSKPEEKAAPELGVVVWVTAAQDLRPIQSTGGLLR